MKRSILSAAILGTLGLGSSFAVHAANFTQELCAGSFMKTLSTDATAAPIPMWGYALGGVGLDGQCINPPTSPGPRITIPDANDGLDVILHNTLPRATSLVIPGTIKKMTPVFFTPTGETIPRVRSFDAEVASGSSATYSWNNLKPGSYMYQSGTHQQVQVQMGLYGAITHDSATGEAYPGKPYSQDVVLFYYEIDRAIHEGVALGNYNQVDMKSTIDYAPKYFMVDVDAGYGPMTFEFNDLPTLKLPNDLNPLVRFFNAGLKIHVPTVYEADFDIIAEDGKPYPSSRKQYTVELPPLKTRDAMLNLTGAVTPGGGSFRLTDSAMAISNPDTAVTGPVVTLDANSEISNGNDNGMVLNIEVAAAPGYVAPVISGDEPLARRDSMSVPEGGSINNVLALLMSNDSNAAGADLTVLTYPKEGELIDDGAGDYTYQHNGGEKSRDSLVYSLTNAAGEKSIAGAMINVIPVNDAPVANDDMVTAKVGQTVEIRALNNDVDVDSPRISISAVDTSSLGVMTALDQVIVFEATTEGSETIGYSIVDPSGATASANLMITVAAAANSGGTYTPGTPTGGGTPPATGSKPTALPDHFTVMEGSVLDITGNTILSVLANDSAGATVNTGLLEYPEHGEIQMHEDGTFVYTHNGEEEEDDHFTYEVYNEFGSTSAEVTISVTPKMDPPRVNNDKSKTSMDQAVLIDILKNDKDKDSALDPNGIVITQQPGHGMVEILAQGSIRYTPDAGYQGKDHFRYKLKDAVTGELSKRSAKVKIKIR